MKYMGLMLCEWNMTVLCICCVFLISVNNVASDFILFYRIAATTGDLSKHRREKSRLYIVKLNNNFPFSGIELTLKAECTVNLHKACK